MASFWHSLTNRLRPDNTPPSPTRAAYALDMHSHLLPNVDDGIKTTEDALVCLRQFADWGIRHVVTTPHISLDMFPNTSDHLRAVANELRTHIEAENLPITFHVAAEYMVDELFVKRLRADDLLSFGAERYVLIETGWASLPLQFSQWLFQLQQQGYRPILAHPERYPYFRGKTDELAEIREQGCLLQLNLMSLSGQYGTNVQRLARTLIDQHLVDFTSSDLHRVTDLGNLGLAFQTANYQTICQLPLTMPTFE